MKKHLIIYKSKESGEIRSANIVPMIIKQSGKEVTVDNAFLENYVSGYQDEYQTVSYIEIPEELAGVITFLRNDRTKSINEHLTALKEISNTLDCMQNDIYHVVNNLEIDFKEQIEKEKKEDE